MSTIHFTATTTSAPEQFIAALTDFAPGRSMKIIAVAIPIGESAATQFFPSI